MKIYDLMTKIKGEVSVQYKWSVKEEKNNLFLIQTN